MYSHLYGFYLSDWRHKHTYRSPKKRRTSLVAAGEPSPALSVSALAGPPQAACGALRPRLPPIGLAGPRARERTRRKGTRVGLRINRHEERAYGRTKEKSKRKESIHQGAKKRSEEEKHAPRCAREPGREEPSEEKKRARPARVRPLWSGAPPLCSAPFRAPPSFWKLPKRGRSPLPAASHRASTNRGRAAPPLSVTPASKDSGGGIQRGNWAGKTGGKSPCRPRKSLCCCCHSAPSISPVEIATARCSLNGEWRRWW